MEIMQVGVIGIVGVLLAIQFKKNSPEFSMLISFAICLLIFFFVITRLTELLDQIEWLDSFVKDSGSYLKILLKVIGITYLCEFCAGVCKDSGFAGIGNQIEVFGKLSVLLSGMPILITLLETIQSFLK